MSKPLIEIRVRERPPFTVTIDPAKKDPASEDYFCRIACEEIPFRVDVFGIIPHQATDLAIKVALAHILTMISENAGREKE